MTAERPDTLPDGYQVRIRSDVRRAHGGRVLIGGSPLRAVRLSDVALGLMDANRLRVRDGQSQRLARQLLDGNVADPVLGGMRTPADLTVVVPARDRAAELDRTLAALQPLPCLVVDDASLEPTAIARVCHQHQARLVVLARNVGPAGARNAGLAHVTTTYVAFVDSDVEVSPATLHRLTRHFADPTVALVGPRVVSKARSARPRWHERYDESSSSLDLGRRACSVRPGAAVAWLPGACVVGRVEFLGTGFDDHLRIGEDVDLVWRLVDAGRTVRYDPTEVARHETRARLRDWLGRKYAYGTGGAVLAARHGSKTAVAHLSPAMAVTAGALLLRRRWSIPVAALGLAHSARSLSKALPDGASSPVIVSRLAVRGLGWSLRQESSLLLRHWWPAAALAATVNQSARRAIVTAVAVDLVAAWVEGQRTNPLTTLAGRRLDDLAYGAGLWAGAASARSGRCLGVVWASSRRRW